MLLWHAGHIVFMLFTIQFDFDKTIHFLAKYSVLGVGVEGGGVSLYVGRVFQVQKLKHFIQDTLLGNVSQVSYVVHVTPGAHCVLFNWKWLEFKLRFITNIIIVLVS